MHQQGPTRAHRRITIVDVARHAGVSTASASKVLRNAYGASEEMRTKVRAAMDELGYRPHRPAQGMRGRTFTFGVMVSDIDNPFFGLVVDGISEILRQNEYEILLSPGRYSAATQNAAVDGLIDHGMDGLILFAPVMSRGRLDRIAEQLPTVVVGRHCSSDLLDSVSNDDELGARLVVDHLVGLGHRRIAFVANQDAEEEPERPEVVRLRGFLRAMEAHGLDDEAVVVDGHWSMEGGREAARTLASSPVPPTAVHAGADVVAFGIMSELWDSGHAAPSDYSVVGYDNSRPASIGPVALTTVDQFGFEMGRLVGELLLERVNGRTAAQHRLLEPRLIVRATTGRPPTSADDPRA